MRKLWRAITVDKKGNMIILYEDGTEEVRIGEGRKLMEWIRRGFK